MTTAADVIAFCARARQRGIVGVDTEFVRRRTFYPIFCLLQLAIDADDAIIYDPLSEDPAMHAPEVRQALADLLSTTAVKKVLHGADQDVQVIQRAFGITLTPVYDLVLLSTLGGWGSSPSYNKLVNLCYGFDLDKSQQKSDWLRRPLDAEQLDYALNDVRYLGGIAARQLAELTSRQRIDWLRQEMNIPILSRQRSVLEMALRGMKQSRNPQRFARLRAWMNFREGIAEQRDKPRNWMIDEKTISKLSGMAVPEILAQRGEFPPHIFRGTRWQEFVPELEQIDARQYPRLSAEHAGKVEEAWEQLRVLRLDISDNLGLAPSTLIPNHLMRGWLMGFAPVGSTLTDWRQQVLRPLAAVIDDIHALP